MDLRGFMLVLMLFALPRFGAAADGAGWSDLPEAWSGDLDLQSLCIPGEWAFEPQGVFVLVSEGFTSQPQGIPAAAAFFTEDHKGAAVWSRDRPRGEDLTLLRVMRDEGRGLTMQGYIGEVLAVSRRFERITRKGLFWNSRTAAAECTDGRAPQIEINYYVDSWSGGSDVSRASLALGEDGALIVRFDKYTCWICLFKNRTRMYARFSAAISSDEPAAPHPVPR